MTTLTLNGQTITPDVPTTRAEWRRAPADCRHLVTARGRLDDSGVGILWCNSCGTVLGSSPAYTPAELLNSAGDQPSLFAP